MVSRSNVPGDWIYFTTFKFDLFSVTLCCDDLSRPELLMVLKCFKTGLISVLVIPCYVINSHNCTNCPIVRQRESSHRISRRRWLRDFSISSFCLGRFQKRQHVVISLTETFAIFTSCKGLKDELISSQDQRRH